jgi:hypothetical protein
MPRITLADEVRYFHGCFFPQPLDQVLIDRYAAANQLCIPPLDESSAATIDRIVSGKLDLEAIELVFRHRQRDNFLTKKIRILFYLLEARSAYYGHFINREARFPAALWTLARSAAGTAFKFVKGKYLIWKYELV